ncbi:type VI secretion system Vgr family protein [Acinetobacter faecalis]|uniref:type VI secretion system Vgr family protein n=1 Tax=Acinetobacter faecalis TaxID=2665161 RepID=UPI002A90E86E|nr:type VI secretion system tip protein TssI/VgrG [Acinetobacter faecalis]MDY6449906.1 type VI secretion system tip protein TssI/VgrG [Acinetobacter faecalis]
MKHQIQLFGESLPQSEYGTPYLWFDSLTGVEKINALFEYHLIVKVRDQFGNPAHGYEGLDGYVSKQQVSNGETPASDLDLQSLIGTELAVRLRLDGLKLELSQLGQINDISEGNNFQNNIHGARFFRGLVNRVEVLPVRNRHATYKITLVPWLWLLTKTSNYKVFQNQTVLQVVEEILSAYPYPVEYRCSKEYPSLDYQVQYGESDYEFIVRLLHEHGINFHFEHGQNELTLVISDHNSAYKEMEAEGYRQLSIYPPNQRFPNNAEYIEFFEPAQQLVSGKVQLSDYQFKQPSLVQTAQEQFLWDHHYAEQEVYEWQQGDFVSADEGGAEKAKHKVEQFYQQGYRAKGQGHLKGLQTGFRFSLENHPNSESNRGWLVLGTQITIQDISEEKSSNQFYDSKVEFLVQPDEQILRPDHQPMKPQGRPQTAVVVGPQGEEIYTDQFGRVKVQFMWDRLGEKNDKSTCWLRVSTAWAGNNYGTIHIPRIGQEVIVDFFNADPDMPFVSGRLTNPEQMPIWELPSQKALSGIKSKELGGNQANQLVMDDTTGQVQVHLKSDHQSSELNLGHITRIPDSTGRKDFRGEGFELRTDAYGVLRFAKGFLLSGYERLKSKSFVTDISETSSLLKESQQTHLSMGEAASQYNAMEATADQVEVAKQLDAKNVELIGLEGTSQVNEFQKAHVLMTTPKGISAHAEENIALHSGHHTSLTSQKHISAVAKNSILASAVESIRLFAYKSGMKLVAASSDIDIQAVQNSINILAKLNIQQSANKILLSAQEEVTIIGGGSYTTWRGGSIETGTTGSLTNHVGNFEITGAKSKSTNLAQPEPKKGNLNVEKLFKNGANNQTLAGMSGLVFSVLDAFGQKKNSQLSEEGKNTVSGLAVGPADLEFDASKQAGWVANHKMNAFEWLEKNFVAKTSNDSLFAKGSNMLSAVSHVAGQLASLTGNDKLAKISQGTQALSAGRDVLQNKNLDSLSNLANGVASMSGSQTMGQMSQGLSMINNTQQAIRHKAMNGVIAQSHGFS